MTQKQNIRYLLITGLFFISLGGWLLHLRIHPPAEAISYILPFVLGIISIVIIPFMFLFRNLVQYAYVVNGFFVIIGIITMAHFSYANMRGPISLEGLFLNTTFPDIAILLTKFFIGKALFDLNRMAAVDTPHTGKYFRYPNMGWWGVHFVLVALVYSAGHLLWR
ncbi:MAG: hypothetical protein NT145_03265 [Elusimicrobia bacterium]|nr:hypothetical protein [Elusimicrobiota bacterium]